MSEFKIGDKVHVTSDFTFVIEKIYEELGIDYISGKLIDHIGITSYVTLRINCDLTKLDKINA